MNSARLQDDAALMPLASVVVNNYNYGRFLAQAVDSALAQDYARCEVIVVDDGSTDESRDVIRHYGSCIKPLLKANGGQASALNAGFAASRGDVILFLDADDLLDSSAVSNAVAALSDPAVSKVHWPMSVIDEPGRRTGQMQPPQIPPEGDFRRQVLERGPSSVTSSPTSGNAWSRAFLRRVLPIPEDVPYYRLCADEYLYTLAPAFGAIRTIRAPQGSYRVHGNSIYTSRSFRQKLDLELIGYQDQCTAICNALARNGISANPARWRTHSWFHNLDRATADILATVPEGSAMVLVDGNTWGIGKEFENRSIRPFVERDGKDWGPPPDDQSAINQLEALRLAGVEFLTIAQPCFWWFEEYPALFEHTEQIGRRVISNESAVIFDLRRKPPSSTESSQRYAAQSSA